MKISYSKYSSFLMNPERYRLYYALGLTPEGDETPTNMNLGRRRGRCFHSLTELRAKRDAIHCDMCHGPECIKCYPELVMRQLEGEYGAALVARCERMRAVMPDLGPMQLVEQSFELPIGDGKHSVTGRIDHIFTDLDGHERVGDFKTTKGNRTKKEVQEYFGEMSTSSQAHFYLYAAAQLGHPTDLFTYHVIFDRKDKDSQPRYVPLDLSKDQTGPAAVARTMAGVYAACEAIEGLIERVGLEKPWPHSNNWPCCGDKFFCGYQEICGRQLPKGAVPAGFTTRWKEKIQTEEGQ